MLFDNQTEKKSEKKPDSYEELKQKFKNRRAMKVKHWADTDASKSRALILHQQTEKKDENVSIAKEDFLKILPLKDSLPEHLDIGTIEDLIARNMDLIRDQETLSKLLNLPISRKRALALFQEKLSLLETVLDVNLFLALNVPPQLHRECVLILFEKKEADFFSFADMAPIFEEFLSKEELAGLFENWQEKILKMKEREYFGYLLEILLCQDLPKDLYIVFVNKIAETFDFKTLVKNDFFDYLPEDMQDALWEKLTKKSEEKAEASEEAYKKLKQVHQKKHVMKERNPLCQEQDQFYVDSKEFLADMKKEMQHSLDLMGALPSAPNAKARFYFINKHAKLIDPHTFRLVFKFLKGVDDKRKFAEAYEAKIATYETATLVAGEFKWPCQIAKFKTFLEKDLKERTVLGNLFSLIDSLDNAEWEKIFPQLKNKILCQKMNFEQFLTVLAVLLKKDIPRNLYMVIVEENLTRILKLSQIKEFLHDYLPTDARSAILMKLLDNKMTADQTDKQMIQLVAKTILRDQDLQIKCLAKLYEKHFSAPYKIETFKIFLAHVGDAEDKRLAFAERCCNVIPFIDMPQVLDLFSEQGRSRLFAVRLGTETAGLFKTAPPALVPSGSSQNQVTQSGPAQH